jgi:hypothetical protein
LLTDKDGHESVEDWTQQHPQPGEDTSEVVADGAEDDVGGVAVAPLEEAPAEVAITLEMADDGLDSGSASQFALDGVEDAALLAGDEDTSGIGRVVAAIAFVDEMRSMVRPVSFSVPSMTLASV